MNVDLHAFRMDDYEPVESFLAFHSIRKGISCPCPCKHSFSTATTARSNSPNCRAPRLRQGQVLVRIAASGLNPLDTKIRAGSAAHAKHPLPLVLGIDMAGVVVEALGAGVSAFKAGDEVYGMTGGVGGIQGSLAQYAAVDATCSP